ncbi:hypothetical protein WJX81_003023 [Elliptochloris bilobata]|uniref:Chlorophyllase n=1 Tax=Elliptochloris bilobata TaxID=381761 RepID=A0AAW1S5K6_9CHLO
MLLYPRAVLEATKEVPVIIFGHGFSQPVRVYMGTVRRLARELGAIIIAPYTSLAVALPWAKVEGAGSGPLGNLTASPPAKMQAALIVDMMRAAGYLEQTGVPGVALGPKLLVGHSLGGACSVANAATITGVLGAAVMAPAVEKMADTPINPNIHLDNDLLGNSYRAAVQFFKDDFPDNAKLYIIAGDQDQIVDPLQIAVLFTAARTAVTADKMADIELFTVPGSHIGFEDKLGLEIEGGFFLQLLFRIVNFLVYRKEILSGLLGDPNKQLAATRYVLVDSLKDFLGIPPPFPPYTESGHNNLVFEGIPITSDKKRETAKDSSPFAGSQLAQGIILRPEELPIVPPAVISTWLPPTAALVAYALAHAATVVTAGSELVSGVGLQPLHVEAGAVIVAALAAALVYENALLASGRFLGAGPLLKALSSYRYLAHAFAPMLALVAAEQAGRAGVTWADSPFFLGPVLAVLVGVVSLSAVQAHFALETKPIWEVGVLRYGYKNPGIGQVLPVIGSSVLMLALGVAAARTDAGIWPLLVGPALSFGLSAVPPSKAPMFLTGNLGEVLLLGSLVASEGILRSQGL